jgi:CO/xanthine dehydrogenase Mo-binding subunit/aerobic-type carbon monoxide dehydrogenase small subunit (CoxS/CutS family)
METLTMYVNGSRVQVEIGPDESLADVLRDRLGLIGTKVACGEGECGACTVLLDGLPVVSCITPALKAYGRRVTTIEGLGERGDLHAIQQAFVDATAIQCGYCTPGLIMATKALLDANPAPTEAEVLEGISGNLCRCTGYYQIVEAVLLAARRLRGEEPRPEEVGIARVPKLDAAGKAQGRRKFPQDFNMEDQLYAKVVWSEHPHARVLTVDIRRAQELAGVVRVITAEDVPENTYGIHIPDQRVLVGAGDEVRWLGDRVAIVVAESEEIALKASSLVEVQYEVLEPVVDPREAMRPDSPLVHPDRGDSNLLHQVKIRKGDLEEGFAEADVVVEGTYMTPCQEHAYMQPESGIGYIDGEGRVTIIVATQSAHDDLEHISRILNLPVDRTRQIVPAIGGAFGGREDMYIQHLLALCAYVVRRPVKMTFTREETTVRTGKRHPFYMRYRTGATRAGRLTATEIELVADAGAASSSSKWVLNCAASFSAGPYRIPHAKVDAYSLYTNNAVNMAMRGFGSLQVAVAYETQMNRLAEELGMDPVAFRMMNLLEDGDVSLTGNAMPRGVGIKECLKEVALAAGWHRENGSWSGPSLVDSSKPHRKRGIGVACGYKNVGISFGWDDHAKAEVELRLDDRGAISRVLVGIGASDVGMGVQTALAQIAARTLGVDVGRVRVALVDTTRVPFAGTCSASRHTYTSGNAVKLACQRAVRLWQDALRNETGETTIAAEYDYHCRSQRPTTHYDPETGTCDPHISYGYAAQIALMEVDVETGEIEVLKLWASQDVGEAIHPEMVRGQVAGGVHMGLGYALTEEYVQQGAVSCTSGFGEYLIPTAADMPKEFLSIIVEHPDPTGPFGAKGVGEMPTLPTAPAILAGVHDAVGVWLDRLPATAETVWLAMGGRGAQDARSRPLEVRS